ncbi:MAG: RNase H family protein [Candidatus Marinimicrobia bacterium]|nr:RNase H family protein [Candidatus Neomarinimicrobiota bacterium]
MPLYKKETEKKAKQFIKLLKKNEFNSMIDLDSYRDYLVKVEIFYQEKFLGKANIYYSPKKKSYKLVTSELKSQNFKEEIEELWNSINGIKKQKTKPDMKQYFDIPYIYIDGSFMNETISYGIAVVKNEKLIHKESGIVNKQYKQHHQIGGELFACINTIKWCETNKIKDIVLLYDYEGIEKWATGKWKANKPLTILYKNFMSEIDVNIYWEKVKSHSGDKWNDFVDQLAKDAIKKVK